MHPVLKSLDKIHAECLRTDALAKELRLQVASSKGDGDGGFRWGYSDEIVPRRRSDQPMRIIFTRDVFLLCDSHIFFDYDLGFEGEDDTGPGMIIVAYRLDHTHMEFGFPVTIFLEAVSNRWRGTARIRHGEDKHTPYKRPEAWTKLLEEAKLDQLGELAEGMSAGRAMEGIAAMLEIACKHAPTRQQYADLYVGS
ncbi:hypothetical protein IPH19_02055 [Candidatus Uhrbacteria bacterium]|nr:MAG: hypothetical protein IPH19_02055 [Candidatus Uhrbacteria bacterium]